MKLDDDLNPISVLERLASECDELAYALLVMRRSGVPDAVVLSNAIREYAQRCQWLRRELNRCLERQAQPTVVIIQEKP